LGGLRGLERARWIEMVRGRDAGGM
jgi:hypothetical protein